jgi:putative tricarboxylic transport membrane protein
VKVNDAVSGVVLIVLGAAIFIRTLNFPPMPGQNYNSALFPGIIAVLMGLSGVVLIVKGVAARREARAVAIADWMRSPAHVLNFALLIALLVFYILASSALGFLPSAFIILAVLMTRLRGRARLGSSLAIAALATIAMQQFFGGLLRVPLPWGVIPPFSW